MDISLFQKHVLRQRLILLLTIYYLSDKEINTTILISWVRQRVPILELKHSGHFDTPRVSVEVVFVQCLVDHCLICCSSPISFSHWIVCLLIYASDYAFGVFLFKPSKRDLLLGMMQMPNICAVERFVKFGYIVDYLHIIPWWYYIHWYTTTGSFTEQDGLK